MKTPIETIKDLPPIIIFTNSNYQLGISFPLEIGIFADGEATSFIIRPQLNWLLGEYDDRAAQGKPLSYFFENGLELKQIRDSVEKLTAGSEFNFYLREDYDPRFFHFIGFDETNIRNIDHIDTYENYDQRYDEIKRRVHAQNLNMFSIKDVVKVVAEQTFDNLKYQCMSDLMVACRNEHPLG
ncbi:hypothetical protein [Pseudoalteromonas piscicida]|uniref:hypothetical protein n=1 Tax=Pseudoalteromonas piscicida TaxID=43662 RepID=UPI000E35D179|nr:hypothetical protein [Pseudoalteromonas piscicida]AXQ98996.1 hypothetical protein D0N37_15575 [Pseudoalteromonas piscicida]